MKLLKHAALALVLLAASCQNKEIEIADPVLQPIDASAITGALTDDYDCVWSWPAAAGLKTEISTYEGKARRGEPVTVDGGTFRHVNLMTNVEYTYVFKLTDGTHFSKGVVKRFTRQGATPAEELAIVQKKAPDGGFEAFVEWKSSPDADNLLLTIWKTDVEAPAEEDFTLVEQEKAVPNDPAAEKGEYKLGKVELGQTWKVRAVAANSLGKALPAEASLLIGRTGIGFLSIYESEEQLDSEGDDDEKYAWHWMKKNYPEALYVPFGSIESVADIEDFRVLFWIRDLELGGYDDSKPESVPDNVSDETADEMLFTMPDAVAGATPYLSEWYAGGGNLLLWSHAVPYICDLGRLEKQLLKESKVEFGLRAGFHNNDEWFTAVSLTGEIKVDNSSHRLFRGLDMNTRGDGGKETGMIGAGWKENHNVVMRNIPTKLTGKSPTSPDCYRELTEIYGIYPLGTWNDGTVMSQVWDLNLWEVQKGGTEYKGTVLCIGNGGCEFWQNNADGSKNTDYDKPNNKYQEHVEKLAKNAIEYLKTR